MRDVEYPPLHSQGIKDIGEEQLYPVFVEAFGHGQAHDYRENLLIRFGQFINQFKQLGIGGELWIDGSFATQAPDPSDVDVVFFFDPMQVNSMSQDKKDLFERLFNNRRFIKTQYRVEVFFGTMGNAPHYDQWRQVFGTGYDNVTPKGIFRLYFN